jgi:hypothetical protein
MRRDAAAGVGWGAQAASLSGRGEILIHPAKVDQAGYVTAIVFHLTRKSFVGMVSYLLGVAATSFEVRVAFVLYALTPLFFITPPQPRQ